MHIHDLIEDSASLANLCTRLAQSSFITVDTEFMRENSYWPELCLIQIADENEAAAIDPLATGIDLTPLLDLMVDNADVLKVFHAGGQDLEIVYNMTGKTPYPLFDTQVAAMALGQGEQIGYSNLVDAYLGIQVDKGARFTDWSRRPLDKRQLDYAIADVTHLSKIFPKMLAKLKKTGRGDWLNEEMERLANPGNYYNDPDLAWRRLRINSRKADVLGRLKALGRWRELEAQNKNLPRGRIVKDETLADIASHPPRKQSDLPKVRGLSGAWGGNDIGARMMVALSEAEPLAQDEMPSKGDRKPALGKDGALVADLLKLLLKIRSRDISVASRLLARSDDLEALAAGQRDNLPVLQGWRYEQFGRDALALVEGRLGFTVRGGKLKMTRTEEEA
ncbi:ribonuclease D [Stakelama saccharophila]|uniref:Ribonuclease D n=1 Tax=Stakelama saccharophila TaxID=3075605 RepID=A0ABZ0B5E2_9SPHN|nr:ribonuclease D [Stakelama sp. W311]WNO52549.1 ribonuclease D [Stakelama sp. W311]